MRKCVTIVAFIVLFHNCLLYSQSHVKYSKYYYPEDLDYLPHFTKVSYCQTPFSPCSIGFELTSVIENLVNSCSIERYVISSYTGDRFSGVMPKVLADNPWAVFYIDSLGNAYCEDISKLDNRENLKSKLNEALAFCRLNPGLIQNKPVSCRLIFILRQE